GCERSVNLFGNLFILRSKPADTIGGEEGVPLLASEPGEGDIVKIAFVALPHAEDPIVMPPLPVGYIAALLEQQRHIVRIYDLALHDSAATADSLAPLRAFRPHITVVASTNPAMAATVEAALAGCNAIVMPLGVDLRVAA